MQSCLHLLPSIGRSLLMVLQMLASSVRSCESSAPHVNYNAIMYCISGHNHADTEPQQTEAAAEINTIYIREIVRSASHCSAWRFTSLFGMSLLITLMLQVGSIPPFPARVCSISSRSYVTPARVVTGSTLVANKAH